MTPRWHLITGEYPPQPGGVSDYTAMVAADLADAGREVHVWAPRREGETPEHPGVTVHRVADGWSPADLLAIGKALDDCPGPRRLFVQYTPSSWGYKSLNFAFGRWLLGRQGRGDEVWLMVHEAYYTGKLLDKPIRWILPLAHRLMMRDSLAASARAFVSTPRYETTPAPLGTRGSAADRLVADPEHDPGRRRTRRVSPPCVAHWRRKVRRSWAVSGRSAGEFARCSARRWSPCWRADPERLGLILGRGGKGFADELRRPIPSLPAGSSRRGGWRPGRPLGISGRATSCCNRSPTASVRGGRA